MAGRNFTYVEDDPPHLKFERDTRPDPAETKKHGRVVHKPALVVYVSAHGDDKTSVPYIVKTKGNNGEILTPWADQLKERLHHGLISENYYQYCLKACTQFEEKGHVDIEGTPVNKWPQIQIHEVKNLQEIDMYSVEQVANMNEDTMARYGMGARALKSKAKAYLESNDSAVASEKIVDLETKLDSERERNNSMEKKLAELELMMDSKKSK